MRKQLAIGIDDFRRIREEDYFYIDKTLLIRDFLTYKKYVSLITRPRRFGKTLNMTMMREFFDISKDSSSIFKGLDIMNTEFAKQMNTLPVIYLTFKNCSGNTPEALKESLAKAIWEEYIRYAGLFGTSVDKEDDHYYKFYLTYQKLREEVITDSILESSLSRLMRAAYAFYGKRPIVLIDEYDHPIIKSYEKGFYDKFSDLYTNFLGEALKGNDFLGQALLTGIQQIAKESIFSELNNFLVYTSLSKQYAAYFGMQKNEVKKMLSYYKLELTEEISTFYNGYVFGGVEIYNPWSLLSYLDAGTLKPYWRNTSTNTLVRALIKDADHDFMGSFERLLIAGEVKVAISLEASLQKHSSPRVLWGMFVNTGYLTIVKESTHGMSILRIPNLEAKEEIRRMIASYTHLSYEKLSDLFVASISNDINAFVKVLQNLVCEYDGIFEFQEDNYGMLFLGMAASVTGLYRFLHYPQLGSTVSGFALQSMHPDLRPSILVEMRKGDDVEKLKQDALAEILHGRYYSGLEGKVLCVGLARNERTCEIAVKRIHQTDTPIDIPAPRVVAPPVTAEPPKVEAPKTEPPKAEAPRNEASTNVSPRDVTPARSVVPPENVVLTKAVIPPKNAVPTKVVPPENAVPTKAVVPPVNAAPSAVAPSEIAVPTKAVVPPENAAPAKTVVPPVNVVPTKAVIPPENTATTKAVVPPKNAAPTQAVALPKNAAPNKAVIPPNNVIPTNAVGTYKLIEQDEMLEVIPRSKAAVIELVPPPEPAPPSEPENVAVAPSIAHAPSTKGSHVAGPSHVARPSHIAGSAANVINTPVTVQATDARGSHVAQPTTNVKGQQVAGRKMGTKISHVAQPLTNTKGSHVASQATNAKISHVAQPATGIKGSQVAGQATNTKISHVAQPGTNTKGLQVARPTTSSNVSHVAQPATGIKGPQVAGSKVSHAAQPITSVKSPHVAGSKGPQVAQPTANTKSPHVAQPTANTKGSQVAQPATNAKGSQVAQPKANTKSPHVAQPATNAKGSQVAQPAANAKGSQVAQAAANAKNPQATELVDANEVTLDTKQPSPSKVKTSKKKAKSAKANASAKQAESAKAGTLPKQAEAAKAGTSAKQAEAAKANTSAKQAESAKAGTSAKQAESTKANTSAKQVESAKAGTSAKQAESTKANTSTKQAESAKADTATESAKIANDPAKSIRSQKTKKGKDPKNDIEQNDTLRKKSKKPSFLKILVANIHIILAILFLFGAIFFAVTNFRANRAASGVALEYQVHATLVIEQEDEIFLR